MTGGTVESKGSNNECGSYGIYNAGGVVVITEGTISSSGSSSNNRSVGIENFGSLEIAGGTINCSEYGIYNKSAGSIDMTGGVVSTNGNNRTCYGIYNSGAESIKITGGIVDSNSNSTSYGLYNRSTGSIEIMAGTISSSSGNYGLNSYSYGVYNYSTGNIIIGTKGDGVVSQEEPIIKGEYTGTSTTRVGYGIYNTKGQFYFYDGKIEGTTKALFDTITEKEQNTELNYSEDETILTLSSEIADVAQIGEITYTNLQEAIDSVSEVQSTIKLLRNVTYTSEDMVITISNTQNIILDLNGYKITSTISEKTIQNEGLLEIIDTSENQIGTVVTSEETTINNASGAKLIISGGTIENRSKQSIHNEGKVIIKDGTVTSNNSSNNRSSGIYNTTTGKVEITGGIVKSTSSYHGHSYGIYNESTGNVEITGGTVSSTSSTSYQSTYSYGIYNVTTGNIIITGGTINSESSYYSGYSYGIYNGGTGSIEITKGILNATSGVNSYGIYNRSTGSITIGIKGDELISQQEPSISVSSSRAEGYGIYNSSGYLYFYDGIVEGKTNAINGKITEIEDLTELVIEKDTTEIITLEQKTVNVASANGAEYTSIQKAVQACGENESIITILRDVNPAETIVIGANQSVTINLNGYTVNNYQEITNNGTLKIQDTSTGETGKIIGLTGIAITNAGTMELQGGSIADSGYGIKNTGILTLNRGIITNNTYGIYNSTNGTTTISSGTINSNTYGVYNYAGTTEMTGGNITSNTYGIYTYAGMVNILSTGISNNTYGVYNFGGTTNIKEGSQISSTAGIYNASGTINIGESGTMNSETPVIIGEEYGLTNTSVATVYMYDGQIKGKTGATQGYITYTETGYTVANKVDGEYYVNYLVLAGTISTVAEVNGISFSNLQSAINSVIGEEAQTIKLTNGISESGSYTIGEEQKIILDMNGKTITSDQEVTITNNGTLTIVDTSGKNVAKISNTVGTAIINNGTLSLGENDGTVNQDLINIDGTTYGIENSGTLNFYDGTINGASAVNGTITTRADGYVTRTTTVDSKERYYLTT